MATASRFESFLQLIQSASQEEILWMNNYLAGLLKQTGGQSIESQPSSGRRKITITYGTETGNSKRLATDFASKAKKRGIAAKLVSLDQYKLNDLGKEELFLTVVSTHGDGEPPEAAKNFYEHIHNNGFKIPQLKFAVLALGDTSYPLFCKTGEDIDEQLQKLGAERVVPLQKCDLDYEETANNWFENLLRSLDKGGPAIVTEPAPVPVKKAPGKKIYNGRVETNINLNGRGSNKKTHHIEIAAEGLEYLPGDALGVVPENPPELVNEIIALAGIEENKIIEWRKASYSVRELLTSKVNIHFLQEKILKQYAALVHQEITEHRADLADLLKKYPLSDAGQMEALIGFLNPIPPRLYTISSSPAAHPGQVHITVVKDRFRVNDHTRHGLCSTYLENMETGTSFSFFIQPNKRFRLAPADKDIIMIGPGTGIAPFRSFIAERDALGANGRSWLFFGEQHFTTDFLYQTEWQDWFSTGSLTKINLAFSRDQEEKIYVQQKLLQHAVELFEWIREGAYLYICGKKDPMSADVEQTLVNIFEMEGGLSNEAAKKYLEELKDAGRYEKDVY
jgi:sulfite reductase (NADPH) flavoprotein alpha-component